ncbi:MAG: SOS response-associated peptidase [Chloroflexales bacterium]|nr:SOS response-associated peptidase [Chloroflexales bacterium]
MCTRFVSKTDQDTEREWSLVKPPFEFNNIDARLTTQIPIVYQGEEGRVCEAMRWGLIPFWFNDDKWKAATWNARCETMAEKASYRGPWRKGNRCLFPIQRFYEWQEIEGQKQKQRWFIRIVDEPMAIAGLWDSNNKHGLSATMITMPANELMQRIHNSGANKHRMPLLVQPGNFEAWLTEENDVADHLIQPYPAARMEAWPVPPKVTPDDLVKP